MSKQNFDKFINKEVKGAKKKEQIKQEKKQVKKEREAYFIEKKREQRAIKKLQDEQQKKEHEYKKKGPTRESGGNNRPSFEKTPNRTGTNKGSSRNSSANEKVAFTPASEQKSKPAEKFIAKKEWKEVARNERPSKPALDKKPGASPGLGIPGDKPIKSAGKKPLAFNKPPEQVDEPSKKTISPSFSPGKPGSKTGVEKPKQAFKTEKPLEKHKTKEVLDHPANRPTPAQPGGKFLLEKQTKNATGHVEDQMPLNKYIAHCGVCSRRDAGEMVKSGRVTVNGEKITDPGTKVTADHQITIDGKKIHLKQTLVYILLNKPKDYITTAEDPQGRKTVLDIVKNATPERIFPVGRLDRNTSGVLLLTNDGDLAQQLTHPSFEVRKIYEAKLDKPLTKADFTKLAEGITLEDGFVQPDSVAYADNKDKSIIGIEIHSGRNRVVRRMFEHLGYDVRALDRVMFANLTKKNVDRGKWRFLNDKEIRLLKFFKSAKR